MPCMRIDCAYTKRQSLNMQVSMKPQLQIPAQQASTSDWKAWAQELREMPSSPEVKAAQRQADRVLAQRKQSKRAAATSSRGGLELAY